MKVKKMKTFLTFLLLIFVSPTSLLSTNSQAHFAHAIIICKTAPNKDTRCINSGWPQKKIPF